MAAVLHPRPAARRPSNGRQGRPSLVLIEGGRSAHRAALRRVHRRRRLAVLTVAVLVVLGVLHLLGGSPAGTTGAGDGGPATAPVVGSRVVAQPGDTVWDVAVALDRPGDVRDTVDRLVAVNGSARLTPGQVIEVPADLRA